MRQNLKKVLIEQTDKFTEEILYLENVDPLLVLGFQDQHLNKIDRVYEKTKITARGNKIKLIGSEKDINEIRDIIEEMVTLALRNGKVNPGDVDTLLALSDRNQEKRSNYSSLTSEPADVILHTHTGDTISTKTPGQKAIVKASENNDILFAIGPAGTGKTFTSVALAVRALKERKVKKIILARPAVEAGENLGFLPGDLREKIDPYLRPLYDALEEMIEHDKLEFNLARNVIEIAPLAYMRGRTLNNAFVILDEAQNATNIQMKMFLTRIGFNSQAIITGDITQTDLPHKQHSGLISIQNILKDIEGISFVYLNQNDVVRHKLVRQIIDAYEKHEKKQKNKK